MFGTCKVIQTLCVYDSKTSTSHVTLVNTKYKQTFTLEQIRELCQVKGSGVKSNLYCSVLTHVTFTKRSTVEIRHRFGWGVAQVPVLQAKSINHWISKRPLDNGGGDDGDEKRTKVSNEADESDDHANQPSASQSSMDQLG